MCEGMAGKQASKQANKRAGQPTLCNQHSRCEIVISFAGGRGHRSCSPLLPILLLLLLYAGVHYTLTVASGKGSAGSCTPSCGLCICLLQQLVQLRIHLPIFKLSCCHRMVNPLRLQMTCHGLLLLCLLLLLDQLLLHQLLLCLLPLLHQLLLCLLLLLNQLLLYLLPLHQLLLPLMQLLLHPHELLYLQPLPRSKRPSVCLAVNKLLLLLLQEYLLHLLLLLKEHLLLLLPLLR